MSTDVIREDMGRDNEGYRVMRVTDSGYVMDVRVTECCGADAKGSVDSPTGVICRHCHASIDVAMGGPPNPPYQRGDGTVTATHRMGWDEWGDD